MTYLLTTINNCRRVAAEDLTHKGPGTLDDGRARCSGGDPPNGYVQCVVVPCPQMFGAGRPQRARSVRDAALTFR